MKLLIDVNLSPSWSQYLRAPGHHAVHWSAIGDPNAPDTEIMRYATDAGFVVLTRDLDFTAILAASGASRPSVVQLRGSRQFPNIAGERVIEALLQLDEELAVGAVVTIDVGKTRFRVLPLDRQ